MYHELNHKQKNLTQICEPGKFKIPSSSMHPQTHMHIHICMECVHTHTHTCSCPLPPGSSQPALHSVCPIDAVRPGGGQRPLACDELREKEPSAAWPCLLGWEYQAAQGEWCYEDGGVQLQLCPQSPPGLALSALITLILTSERPGSCWALRPDADQHTRWYPAKTQKSGEGTGTPHLPWSLHWPHWAERKRKHSVGGCGGTCLDSLLCGQMASHLQSPLLSAWPGLVLGRDSSKLAQCVGTMYCLAGWGLFHRERQPDA